MSVVFDDVAVADFFDEQVDLGRYPEEFSRIWLHTHPGGSAQPSHTDEETFLRCFGRTDWAVMFILARQGETYTRLRFNVGPGGALCVQAQVDFAAPFDGSAHGSWETEYQQNVFPEIANPQPPLRMPEAHEISELWELGPADPFVSDDHRDLEFLDQEDHFTAFDPE